MKRIICILLGIAMMLSLIACGKSQSVLDIENAINEIGVVTIDSEPKIISVEQALNDLNEKEKDEIDNINILNEARSTYNNLKKEQVELAIESIGTVSLESARSIVAIRKQYDDCNDEIKEAITNYQLLVDAEKELSQLKADQVIVIIEEIGSVTLEDEDKITEAKSAYAKLSNAEKKLVTNYQLLVDAEGELSQLRANQVILMIKKIGTITLSDEDKITEATAAYYKLSIAERELVTNRDILLDAPNKLHELKLSSAKAKLRTKTDKVEGKTWYESKKEPYYADSRSYVFPYIGQSSSSTWLRLRYHYTGKNWIFFERVIIVIDDEKYTKTFGYSGVDRDNDTEVWEWADVSPTSSDIDMLWKIVDSKETIVRFQGDKKHYDMTVSSEDKQGIKDVLTAYELMK